MKLLSYTRLREQKNRLLSTNVLGNLREEEKYTYLQVIEIVFNKMSLLYIIQCKMDSVQCSLYSVQCTVYSVQCKVYSLQCKVYFVQCTVYTVDCRLYSVHFSGKLGCPVPTMTIKAKTVSIWETRHLPLTIHRRKKR